MTTHMLLMSFDDSNLINLFHSLHRFFEYSLALLQKKSEINFCYIGTAANDSLVHRLFFSGFIKAKFGRCIKTTRLLLTKKISQQQIEDHIRRQDILFIGGGNTEQMLKIWESQGFTTVLNKLKNENALPILAGVSAGGMYPFHSGITDATPGHYRTLRGLDWFKQSFCPHANSKHKKICAYDDNRHHERMAAYQVAVELGHMPSGYAVPDNCMLHFSNFEFVRALTAQADSSCYYVTPGATQSIETTLLTKQNTLKVAHQ